MPLFPNTEFLSQTAMQGLPSTPTFFTLDRAEQQRGLEALIFASEEPLSNRMLHRLLVLEDVSDQSPGQQPLPLDGDVQAEPAQPAVHVPFEIPKLFFEELVDEINYQLEQTQRPYRIVKIAGGFQFATTPEHGMLVKQLLKAKTRKRLTQAAMEVLAVIAYRQPITKTEIDSIRGVNSGEVVNSLVEKGLVTMVGRSETPGKPLLYGSTDEFLRTFGLVGLSDLPKLREIDDLLKTTTTFIELDSEGSYATDHKTLRKQLAALLDESNAEEEVPLVEDANSGAYFADNAKSDQD
jgi:segregation and condensation protein B